MAIINGTSGDDTLNGTSSADQIFGFGGNDTLNGNGGNDRLDGGTGADTMSGGTGNDIYFVDDAGDTVTEAAGEGTDEVRTTLASYALGANVEHLRFTGAGSFTGTGNALNNDIYGGGSNDTISGGDGHDYLAGNGGDDSLYGGDGHDTLYGGDGADHMEGSTGNDVYLVYQSGDVVVENAGEGIDEVRTTLATYTLGADVENLWFNLGGGAAFHGIGNSLDNLVSGQSGDDTLEGGDGTDELRGNTGDDTLDGGDGDDLVVGASGADVLTGGAGADRFQIGYYESGTGADADRITDFASGDLIDVSGWDADINNAGNQAFTFIGNAAFSGTAGELRTYFDGVDTWVQGDISGDGAADFEVVLTGAVTLVSADFVL